MSEKIFPPAFEDLERFAPWALPTRAARVAKTQAASIGDAKAFYGAMLPRMRAVIDHLNQFELGRIPEGPETRLYHLALAFMNAAQPVELGWDRTSNPHSFPFERTPFTPE
jgi:hypothetical protein